MKKITALEILLVGLMTISISLSICGKNPPPIILTFQVDMNEVLDQVQDKNTIGIRGNIAPLSWEKTYVIKDENKDGIYEGSIAFEKEAGQLEFKFVHDDVIWELTTETNRVIDLTKKDLKLPTYQWNENPPLSIAETKALTIPKEKLLEDFEIVKTAYTTMHPGLYRYNTPAQIEQHLAVLKADCSKDLTIPEAYIAFSKFVAQIKCGHTYANFWNQPMITKRAVNYQTDKVPFHFRLAENRMIVTESATSESILKRGTEILSINGRNIEEMLATLLPLQSTDGANAGHQLACLQLFGGSKFEAFDMYFPILFPPKAGKYELSIIDSNNSKVSTVSVPSMSRKERIKIIKKRYPNLIPDVGPDLWNFKMINDETALLTLHSFSIWNWDFDWEAYIKNVFSTLNKKKVPNLIIDIRLNGGGADMVGLEVLKNISQQPIVFPARKQLGRFQEFPSTVKPHIGTWDDSFEKSGIKKLKPMGDGYYAVDGKISAENSFKPYKNNYQGKVYLLVSPFNSSATYYMAGAAKRNGAATLIGQETGGNQKGINGGLIYFLNLPNSKIELDIPVIGDFQIGEHPDKGYEPDVFVAPNVEDIVKGIDTELAATLELIAKEKKN